MNGLLIPPFLCAVVSLVLGAFVFTKNPRSPVHRSFAFLCWETTWWQVCWFATYFFSEPAQKDMIMRIAYIIITFLPVTYYHYAVRFLKRDKEWPFVRLGYWTGVGFLGLLWTTDWYIAGYIDHWWGYYPRVGVLHPIYLVGSIAIIVRSWVILRAGASDSHLSPATRNRNRFAFYSHFIYSMAAIEYAITYGVINIYPVGVFALLAAFGITTYAIVQHHLLDIRVAVTRGMIFVVLHAAAIGLPFFIAVSCKDWLKAVAGEWWWALPFGLQSLLTSVAPALYRFFQYHAEDRLLRKERQYQAAIRTMSQELIGFADVNSLCSFVGRYVSEQMGLASAELLVHGDGFGMPHAVGDDLPGGMKEVLERWRASPTRTEAYILAEELGAGRSDTELRSVIRTWLTRRGYSALVPGWLRGELVSCLVVGPKRTGEIFAPEDFEVLDALARQSSLVIKNLELYEEVAEQKRLAQFGELMAAINHEFNNVFAIIGGTLQQLIENPNDPSLKQHLAGLQEEILRGQYIIRAASAYRKKHKSLPQRWSLATLLEETLAQAQQDAFAGSRPRFTVTTTIPKDVEVVGRATIPELISNCLRCLGWACDRKPGTLQLEISQEGTVVQLRVVMTGGEDLRAVIEKEGELAPEPGRHGGLYYFLVKLIVADHRGSLAIESTPGGGTTLRVRLPQEQAASLPSPEPLAPHV